MVAADPLHRYPDAGACAGELAAPFRASPLFSRATEELAALSRAAVLPAVVKVPVAPAPEPARGISGVGALLVAVLALGGGIGIGVWRLRAQQEAVEDPVVTQPAEEPVGVAPGPLVEARRPPSEYAIKSEPPGAALWINHEFRGNAPGQLTLPQGEVFSLHLELPAHKPVDLDVRPDGAPHPFTFTLQSDKTLGGVRFDVSEETRIWLDGVSA